MAGLKSLAKDVSVLKTTFDEFKRVYSLKPSPLQIQKDPELEKKLFAAVGEQTKQLTSYKKETDKDIQDLRDRVNRASTSWGGGNANRNVTVGSSSTLTRYTDINWIPGSNMGIAVSVNDITKVTNFTLYSTGGGGGGGTGYQAATGTVDGINTSFSFPTAPAAVAVDGGVLQKTSSDGTVNWTGTTTITLSVAPNFDIFGIG